MAASRKSLRRSRSEPLLQSSMTTQSAGGMTLNPFTCTTLGCLASLASIITSSRNALTISAVMSTDQIILMATGSPLSLPRYTFAAPPAPNTYAEGWSCSRVASIDSRPKCRNATLGLALSKSMVCASSWAASSISCCPTIGCRTDKAGDAREGNCGDDDGEEDEDEEGSCGGCPASSKPWWSRLAPPLFVWVPCWERCPWSVVPAPWPNK
mmetsp:Transcript_18947/g.37506  ORF Transcript_18947/g.37506 Transcript_18947/m.37506 type:complete len:211 (-) Transcript_18947:111-743(-)